MSLKSPVTEREVACNTAAGFGPMNSYSGDSARGPVHRTHAVAASVLFDFAAWSPGLTHLRLAHTLKP